MPGTLNYIHRSPDRNGRGFSLQNIFSFVYSTLTDLKLDFYIVIRALLEKIGIARAITCN